MIIRFESPADVRAISELTTAAFEAVPQSQSTEAGIIEQLRADGALTLSLVAASDDEIIGHVAFSPVAITGGQEGWYGLGPVAVKPNCQKQGIGQALIRRGLEELQGLGALGCVVLGDPHYYQRFGFESDPTLTFAGQPSPYFQRLVFAGSSVSGDVVYHPAFGCESHST